jgi:hypothetical protein
VTQLHVELEGSKVKMSKLEKEINDVDFNQKKNVEEMNEKLEVERCVIEMVAWVSEDLTNKQVVENLNKVAKKVNQIGEKVYSIPSPKVS